MTNPNKRPSTQPIDPQIKFADEPTPAALKEAQLTGSAPKEDRPGEGGKVLELPVATPERNRANQIAAQKVVAEMTHKDLDRDYPRPKVTVPKLSEEDAKRLLPKRYRVMAPSDTARGASRQKLPAGKVIDANNYDIAGLRAQGVQLEEVKD